MLTAHTIKTLKSLDQKKYRQKYNLFLVEGNKIIHELLDSNYKVREIFSTKPENVDFPNVKITPITTIDLKKISFLQTPKDSVAVCEIRDNALINHCSINIVLDGIQDPGNFGTIIRLADWFGIDQIICSEDCVDLYNPKVIQASMGSFCRVNIIYQDLTQFLATSQNSNVGTDMDGENLYEIQLPEKLNLVFGNEGNGMRNETRKLLEKTITIPRFGKSQSTESLNVSVAAAIILGQIFKSQKWKSVD